MSVHKICLINCDIFYDEYYLILQYEQIKMVWGWNERCYEEHKEKDNIIISCSQKRRFFISIVTLTQLFF